MSKWNLDHIRKIAGLPLTESVAIRESDDDEDLSPAERELAAKAEKDLQKKGVKVKNVDPEKDISRLAQKHKKSEEHKESEEEREERESAARERAEKESESKERKETEKAGMNPKAAQKQERKEAAKKEEEKRGGGEEKPAAEAKRRGKAPSENSGAGKLRSWIAANPGKGRKEAWAYARETIGMTPAGFSTNWQKAKGGAKAATEAFVLLHPSVPSFLLAENREMNQYQWVDMGSALEPLVFFTEAEAQRIAKYMAEWKNQQSTLVRVDLTEAEEYEESSTPIGMPAATEEQYDNPVRNVAYETESGWFGVDSNGNVRFDNSGYKQIFSREELLNGIKTGSMHTSTNDWEVSDGVILGQDEEHWYYPRILQALL